jgi:hypothetical protein
MPSIDDVAERVRAAAVPVLFLDTCILLDIVRSTHRCLPNYAGRALELLDLVSTSPPRCLAVIASLIPNEWNANFQQVTDEVIWHFATIEEQVEHFHDACEALGISIGFERADYTRVGLAERLCALSRQLVDTALCLDADDESVLGAHRRFISKLPPFRKNRGVEDCTIIEEFLAVCRKLKAIGFARRRVFCTSNTSDYCEAGKELHPALAADFAACDLSFTTDLPWAVHEITH